MLAVKTEREGSNSLLTLRKSRTASKNSVRLSCSCCPTCGRVVEQVGRVGKVSEFKHVKSEISEKLR